MTLFDHTVLVLVGFSVLLGVIRGITREVIALASWLVAFLMASVYGGEAAPLLAQQIPDESWRVLAAFIAVFFVVLIVMNVIAFEGLVKVCNLAGVCVLIKAGQMTSVRNGDNSAPAPPTQAALDLLVATTTDTNVGAPSGAAGAAAGAGHLGVLGTVGIVAGAVGVGLGVGLSRGGGTPVQRGCKNPNPQTGLCP